MNGKHFRLFVFLLTLGTACESGLAAEPVLDLRTPQPDAGVRALAAVRMDDRPAWVQRIDTVARHGLTFMCLRHGHQSSLVLGAHPNGYVGVFTTLPGGAWRGRPGC
jgi:hypothetical protein